MSKLNNGNSSEEQTADNSALLAQQDKPTKSVTINHGLNPAFFSQADLQEEASSSAIQAIRDMKPF